MDYVKFNHIKAPSLLNVNTIDAVKCIYHRLSTVSTYWVTHTLSNNFN